MKIKLFSLGLIMLLAAGAAKAQQTQVLEFAADKVQNKGREFVYENDTLRIQYELWGERGLLSFSVYNKTAKPLFIDWSRSYFAETPLSKKEDIKKAPRIPYWEKGKKHDSLRYGANYYGGEPVAIVQPVGTEAKQYAPVKNGGEKVTELLPEHGIFRTTVKLFPKDTIRMDTAKAPVRPTPPGAAPDTVKRRPQPVRNLSYSEATSPLQFVNSIAISHKADGEGGFTVTQKFYLRSVRVVPQRMFTRFGARPGMNRPMRPGADTSSAGKAKGDTAKAGRPLPGGPMGRAGMPGGEGFNPMKRANAFYLNGTPAPGFDPIGRPGPGGRPRPGGNRPPMPVQDPATPLKPSDK